MNEIGPDDPRLEKWRDQFRFYRDPPTRVKITEWLGQFDDEDVPLAAKVLDHVTVVGEPIIHRGYRTAAAKLDGWNTNPAHRSGRWFFVGFGRAGESGQAMLRLFREANGLASAHYDDLFCNLADLPSKKLTARDNVVFVDDFSGSGRQVTRMWPLIEEMIASEARAFLVLTAITSAARTAIGSTSLTVLPDFELGPEYLLFHPDNPHFSVQEKDRIEKYCSVADKFRPRGYGGLGVLFVLCHKAANNCLPIIYVNSQEWKGLLPRYLPAA